MFDQSAYAKKWRQQNLAKCRMWGRRYYRRNRKRLMLKAKREWFIRRAKRFGLTPSRLRRLLLRKRCEICRCKLTKKWHHNRMQCVDHNHATGKFRGILCRLCNLHVGHAERKFDPRVLKYIQTR